MILESRNVADILSETYRKIIYQLTIKRLKVIVENIKLRASDTTA